MKIKDSIALVTGANGGIGQAFVQNLLDRGAKKVYVAARSTHALARYNDSRLVPIPLDVTDAAEVLAAAQKAQDVTLLINNAGFGGNQGAISASDMELARQEMEVNYFGVLGLTRAFAPILAKSGGGAILNVTSFLSLLTIPAVGTYSASKAATLALSRSIRAELKAQGTEVVVTMPVQVDTPMGQGIPEPRLKPQEVAEESLDAVESGQQEVFPGELSKGALKQFLSDPAGMQEHFSSMLPAT